MKIFAQRRQHVVTFRVFAKSGSSTLNIVAEDLTGKRYRHRKHAALSFPPRTVTSASARMLSALARQQVSATLACRAVVFAGLYAREWCRAEKRQKQWQVRASLFFSI